MRNAFRNFIAISSLALMACACADPNIRPVNVDLGHSTTIATGPALRLVSERPREIDGRGFLPTVCSEPNPDAVIAFGRSLTASANFADGQGMTASGNVNTNVTEAATQLAGRTAGVLALRDGLYAACQAYANGTLGHDAYALVLSQYGALLVALAGTANQAPTAYTPQDAAMSALLVSCVSEWDPTRAYALAESRRAGGPVRETNLLLSKQFCGGLLKTISAGRPIRTASATRPAAQQHAAKNATTVTEKINSTKTTTTVPPDGTGAAPAAAPAGH
jgi:hypothetical protein